MDAHGRRFVGVHLRVPDIRALPKAAPFSWAHYELREEGEQIVFRETLGAPALRARRAADVGWTGDEIVAFRLHLPSRIRFQNSRDLDAIGRAPPSRGNILTWEQRLGRSPRRQADRVARTGRPA